MLAQQLVNALSLGCVYALFALGFTLVFGVLGVINLSHGAVFMVGAYAAEQAVAHFALPLAGALVFAFAASGCLGLVIDWLVLRPLRARAAPHLIPMIATIGVGIILTNTVQGLFGAQNLRFPVGLLPERTLSVGGVDVTVLELGIVVDGRGLPRLSRRVDALLEAHQVSIVDFTAEHAEAAREAYRRFGKGSGHRARLNFGDCIAYAVATVEGEPLLFKGQDFTHTDVRNALTEGE